MHSSCLLHAFPVGSSLCIPHAFSVHSPHRHLSWRCGKIPEDLVRSADHKSSVVGGLSWTSRQVSGLREFPKTGRLDNYSCWKIPLEPPRIFTPYSPRIHIYLWCRGTHAGELSAIGTPVVVLLLSMLLSWCCPCQEIEIGVFSSKPGFRRGRSGEVRWRAKRKVCYGSPSARSVLSKGAI